MALAFSVIRAYTWLQSSQGLTGQRSASKLIHMTVGQRHQSVLSPAGLSTGQLTTWQLASLRVGQQESDREHSKWKSQCVYNLISKVTSHHFCYILFFKAVTRSDSHLKEGYYTRSRIQARRQGSLGAISDAACPDVYQINNFQFIKN